MAESNQDSQVERVEKTEIEWQEQLTPQEFQITRQAGTEQAFTTRVDPGSPPWLPPRPASVPCRGGRNWWRRRVLPPGPLRLFRKPV